MHSIARSPRTARASAWLALATIAALLLSLLAITRPALADAPGNNGTVKIHEGATEEEPIVANDPHVCTFHLHFFFGDDVQAGDWWIEQWAPDDMGTVVLTGTYDATNGEDRQPEQGVYDLPDGHYKLFWEGATNPGGQTEIKHKVFWVDCEGGGEAGQASLSLTKVDQNDDPLADVSFTLTSTSDASVTYTQSTDAEGALIFTGLAADTYLLTEVTPEGCTGVADVTLTLAADGTVTFDGEHAGVTLDADGNLVVENTCEAGGGGGGTGQIMIMKHVCPAGLTPEEFDQIPTFAEKVFTCPVVTLPGDEAAAGARDARALDSSPFPDGTADFDFSVEAGASMSTLTDATFTPTPVDCPASGDCVETSHYDFSAVARGTVTVTETTPPEDYVFGRVLFTPGSGDDATLSSVDTDTGTIVLDTTNDDSVMLHVYNFTGEGAVSPGTGTPAPTEAPPNAPGGGVQPEGRVKGSTGVPNTSLPDPSGGLLLMTLAALLLTGSAVGLAVVNVRDHRRRR